MSEILPQRKRDRWKLLMILCSFVWIAGSVFAFIVWLVSLLVVNRPGWGAYFLLTHKIPTVSGEASLWALSTFPVATLFALLLGWAYHEDDDHLKGIILLSIPMVNLMVVLVETVLG